MAVRHLVTARELERMGREDLELVRGVLVPVMTPAGEQHGTLAAFLTVEIGTFVRAHSLGRVYVEVGYKLFSHPDTVRGPDVSFVAMDGRPPAKPRRGFIPGAPDLAIEIASADKPMKQLAAKAAGLAQTDALDGADVLPGFSLPVSRVFQELEA